MLKKSKIYISGHKGLVGSAILKSLKEKGYTNLITKEHQELDLTDQAAVENFFKKFKPEYIFLAAAKVGGILANKEKPAEFIYDNLMIEANIINNAYKYKVKKLLFLGSSCIYPRLSPQPIKEEYLLTSPLEKTNEAYAIAKIAGLKLCEFYNQQYGTNYISAMPTNLYGPNDNFDLNSSHVLPALIRKFHEAKLKGDKSVVLWGSGRPKREFLHVTDLAEALTFLMNKYNRQGMVNIGCGEDLSIKDLAHKVKKITGYDGKIIWDKNRPDGTPRKLLDITKIKQLGWRPKISLDKGILDTYQWFVENYKQRRVS